MKTKISTFDKIMFPTMNILMVVLVFALLKELFNPSTGLEYTAIILMCGLLATPIANMNRKEMLEAIEVDNMIKEEKNHMRKSA